MKRILTLALSAAMLGGAAYAAGPQMPLGNRGLAGRIEGQTRQKSKASAASGIKKMPAGAKRMKLKSGADNLLSDPTRSVRVSKRMATDGGSSLMGYLIYSNPVEPSGSYDATLPVPAMVVQDPIALESEDYGYNMSPLAQWYSDGVMHSVAQITAFGGMILAGECYYEYDNNGELLAYEDLTLDAENILMHACLVGSQLIGVGNVGGVYGLASAPANDYLAVSLIKPFYNEDDKCLYGVNTNGDLMKISLSGDETTVIGSEEMMSQIEGFAPNYTAGMAYVPNERMIYYNPQTEDVSYLYSFNPATGKLNYELTYENGVEFSMMYTPDRKLAPTAPVSVSNLAVSFEGASRNGSVSFTMPGRNMEGEAFDAESQLKWTVLLDNVVYNIGSAAPGADVVCNLVSIEDGQHTVQVYASNDNDGQPVSATVYVGNDEPNAPENVVLAEDGTLTWDAVTTGAHAGYFDAASVSYRVSLNGEPVGEPVQATTMQLTLPAGSALENNVAGVVAVSNGMESSESYSNSVMTGEPLQVPVLLAPSAEEAALFATETTVNADWSYNTEDFFMPMDCFVITSDSEADLDAWLILPPVALTAGKYVEFSVDALAVGDWVTEEFEMCLGTSTDVSGMKTLKSGVNPEVGVFNNYSVAFTVPSDGKYYLAIHGVSEAWGDGMGLKNFRVDNSKMTAMSPLPVSSLDAIPMEDGSLFANVKFNMPKKSLDGTEYPADAELTARVECETYALVSGKPGETVTAKVATTQSTKTSLSKITVTPSYGDNIGEKSAVSVYTGLDYPAAVNIDSAKSAVNADGISVTLKWDAVTEGAQGLYLDPASVQYAILKGTPTFLGVQWETLDVISDTEYVYSVPAGTEQGFSYVAVLACNEAGDADDGPVFTPLLGEPESLPQVCDLENATEENPLGINSLFSYGSDVEWGWAMAADLKEQLGETIPALTALEGGTVLLGQAADDDCSGAISGPMFSTIGFDDVCFDLTAYTGETACTFNVYGQGFGMGDEELVLIGTMDKKDGFNTQTFTLPAELQNCSWVFIRIEAEFSNAESEIAIIRGFKAYSKKSGINMVSPAGKAVISGGKGVITFKGLNGATAEISRLDGAKVAVRRLSSEAENVTVDKGVYVVKAGEKKTKVFVK